MQFDCALDWLFQVSSRKLGLNRAVTGPAQGEHAVCKTVFTQCKSIEIVLLFAEPLIPHNQVVRPVLFKLEMQS